MSVPAGSRGLGHALTAAVLALHADTRGLALLGVDQHHVGDVNGALALDHPARRAFSTRVSALRAHVALDHVQPLDVDTLLGRLDAQELAPLAALPAGDGLDFVPQAIPQRAAGSLCCASGHQITSGASE